MCRVHLFCRDSRPYKVGYSSITVEPGFHLFTATFEDVAGNEYKLNDIKILNEDILRGM